MPGSRANARDAPVLGRTSISLQADTLQALRRLREAPSADMEVDQTPHPTPPPGVGEHGPSRAPTTPPYEPGANRREHGNSTRPTISPTMPFQPEVSNAPGVRNNPTA
eukprot:6402174-Prorocentrum_lima.AAC.1